MNVSTAPARILVIDDEVTTTLMIRYIFERHNYIVDCVFDGLSGIEHARETQPDIILLDVLMPGMDGFEVLRRLRTDPLTEAIPVIIITANATTPREVAAGLGMGANDYLRKPFATDELLGRVESKLRAYRLEVALKHKTDMLATLLTVSQQLAHEHRLDRIWEIFNRTVKTLIQNDQQHLFFFAEGHALGDKHSEDNPDIAAWLAEAFERLAGIVNDPPAVTAWRDDVIQAAIQQGFTDILISPVISLDGKNCIIVLLRQTGSFDPEAQNLLDGILYQTALASENALLYEQVDRYATELEALVAERTRDLRAAQEMLIRSEKLAALGQLSASIAHEINNPLMPIGLLLDELLEMGSTVVGSEEIVLIRQNVDRIARIVGNLLNFAKSDTEMHFLDVNAILSAVVMLNAKFFQHQNIAIDIQLCEAALIVGSKDHLEAVFMNLFLNAAAAMPNGGTLRVSSACEDQFVVITIADTGDGIDPDNIALIFDPFFSTKEKGTGLGLFVAYTVISNHNGTIEVQSEPGISTTFTIHLPRSSRL